MSTDRNAPAADATATRTTLRPGTPPMRIPAKPARPLHWGWRPRRPWAPLPCPAF